MDTLVEGGEHVGTPPTESAACLIISTGQTMMSLPS